MREWGISFVAVISAVSAFVAIVPGTPLTTQRSLVILSGSLILSGVFVYQRTRTRQLPSDEFLASETKLRCKLQCPPTRQLSEEANALAFKAFGNAGGVPADRYETWRLKNPNILACLLDRDGVVVGYFDVLPLTSEFMDRFIRGDLTESSIRHEDILPPQHARRCKRLYIGGIAVRAPQSLAGKKHARHLMWGLLRYLEHYYSAPSERQIYALGSTKEGIQILNKFNFKMVQDGSRRKDGQALYVTSLSDPEILQDMFAELGDWTTACSLSWQEKPASKVQNWGRA